MALTRKRRRILFATLVVVLGGLWWLTRPNLDPRFVGRWRWADARSTPSGFIVDDRMAVFVINSDGTANYEEAPHQFDWSVSWDGRLIFVRRMAGLPKIREAWHRFVARMTGGMPSLFNELWIKGIYEDHVVLEYTASPAYTMLKRVSPTDPARED
jgi:hypothetical protein